MAMPLATPIAVPQLKRQVWSVGGGKGGIGKSLLTASLGWQLARMGKRVVLVDADLGGANLHTCLGLATPERSLGDFIQRRVERIEDVVVETSVPGLRLVSGASDFLAAANIKHPQKVRVLNKVRSLDVDIVLLDLGAGTSFNIIDFFLDLRSGPSHGGARAHVHRERLPLHQERALQAPARASRSGSRFAPSSIRPSIPRTPWGSGRP